MVNQWGRDGSFGSGNGGTRSAASVIVPAIIALVIGAAGGGYGGARFLGGPSASDLAARDKTIAELNQTLSEIKFDSQGSATEQTVLRQRVKDLQGQVDALKRTKDSLKTYADQQVGKAKDDAEAEIAALKKTIDEAGDLSGQLGRAQKSLKVAELQIIELEKTVSNQKALIGSLQTAANQQADDSAKQAIATLQAQKKALEGQLANARSNAVDADQTATAQIASLIRQKNDLQRKLDAALATAGDSDQQAKKIATLQGRLDDVSQSLADRDKAARDAAAALKQARADLAALGGQNKTLLAARDDLTKKVAALNQTIATLKAGTKPSNPKPQSDTGNSDGQPADGGLTPRSSVDVEKALANMPGYDELSAARQQALVSMLEKGECVTDALKTVYGHVSPVALRSLFRDLGGGC